MNRLKSLRKLVGVLVNVLLVSGFGCAQLFANERRFAYTYESAVLPPGTREFELWSTFREGRDTFYSRLDHRAEFEWGLTERLMSAFYINWKNISKENLKTREIETEFEFAGISSEWKYKLTDPVAHFIGSALYGEATLSTDEIELEGKLIFDKKIGQTLLAYNFVIEPEWKRKVNEVKYDMLTLENDLAFTRFLSERFSLGLELRNHTEINPSGKTEHSALFAGPVVSFALKNWWATLAVMPQISPLKHSKSNPDNAFVVDEHERFNARLLLSFYF